VLSNLFYEYLLKKKLLDKRKANSFGIEPYDNTNSNRL